MNSYNLVLKVKIDSVDTLSKEDIEDLQDVINEDFPTVLLLNEDDWNEKQIDIDTIEIQSLDVLQEAPWEFNDVD